MRIHLLPRVLRAKVRRGKYCHRARVARAHPLRLKLRTPPRTTPPAQATAMCPRAWLGSAHLRRLLPTDARGRGDGYCQRATRPCGQGILTAVCGHRGRLATAGSRRCASLHGPAAVSVQPRGRRRRRHQRIQLGSRRTRRGGAAVNHWATRAVRHQFAVDTNLDMAAVVMCGVHVWLCVCVSAPAENEISAGHAGRLPAGQRAQP
mmetsp:Transcript_24537/g.63351  ORF Transcript_24537/g.63351 Transcript_24537/m.63351 type:complete len:206 (+) Transcript_24537:1483-2100(+)